MTAKDKEILDRIYDKHYGNRRKPQEIVSAQGEYAVACQDYANTTEGIRQTKVLAKIRRELIAQLPKAVFLKAFKFKETDSGNITHAVAYFEVALSGSEKALKRLVGKNKLICGEATKKQAPLPPSKEITTGVGIVDQAKFDAALQQGVDICLKQGHPITRATLMKAAQQRGIKYFRILTKEELTEVLSHSDINDSASKNYIAGIIEKAQVRWKAGWGKKKQRWQPKSG